MKFTHHTLPNGLRVILAPDRQSMASTVFVLVEAGSNYETKDKNGISHFLEHMCFKGTEKRPRAIDISSELDGMGAQYNAFTSNEYTGYYAKVQPRFFGRSLEIVADMYLNPTFDPKEIEKEKGVIVEEINMYEDLPQRRVQELMAESLYGDQPAGWGIAGVEPVVRAIMRDDFVAYRTKHYHAGATIVVCAGNFDEKEALAGIEKEFAGMLTGVGVSRSVVREEQKAPVVLMKEKKSDQAHVVVGVRAGGEDHPDYYAYGVLSSVLGGGMSSRLFQKVREELGAAYYVRASHDAFSNYGSVQASAGADVDRVQIVIESILGEFRRLKQERVPESELNRVKDMLVGNFFLSLETSDDVARYLGDRELVRRQIDLPEVVEQKIRAVTAEDILRVAGEIFVPERLNLAMISPHTDTASFAALLRV